MRKLLLAAVATLVLTGPANAYDQNNVLFGLGVDNLRNSTADNSGGYRAVEARVEWRGAAFSNIWGIHNISPLVGFEVDTKGALYGYAGLLYDWNFYDKWYLVPNISAGAYSHGSGKDLGGVFEFHDSIELDYKLDQASRLGIELTHMSSAGITHPNPGKEDLMLTYTHGL